MSLLVLGLSPGLASSQAIDRVDFNRTIRPILSDSCFQCHGPDGSERKGDFRLDVKQSVLEDRGGYAAVVPGRPDDSELFRRITSSDDNERMPPPGSHRTLSAAQVELVRRWIQEGAKWDEHWAFQPPLATTLPPVANRTSALNPIDAFTLARLEREGLGASAIADPTTLVRRVTLDLTGLPPTIEEVDAFISDRRPDAYERLVDRLLASPRFGEHLAISWLDAARYADTNGYQTDGPRYMWRWRDWVMDALNRNMPFDQFTIEQLAGDLLPNATLKQRIASGFHRNLRGNAEGGIIPEEFLVEYAVDRVDTTSTVWLGLTLGCARCHDHKFDPLTQRDYYQLLSFFNRIPEFGRALKEGNSPPYIKAPTDQQQIELLRLMENASRSEGRYAECQAEIDNAFHAWLAGVHEHVIHDWSITRGLLAHFPLEEPRVDQPSNPTALPVTGEGMEVRPGIINHSIAFDGTSFLNAGDVGGFGYFDRFTIGVWVYLPTPIEATRHVGGTIVSRMVDEPQGAGYSISLEQGHLHVNLVRRWLDDAIRVQTKDALQPGKWHHLAVTYDGSRLASGVVIFVNGVAQPLQVNLDWINQSFATVEPEPFRIGGGGGPDARFCGQIDDIRVFDRVVSAAEIAILATQESIQQLLHVPADQRTPSGLAKLREYFLEQHASPAIQDLRRKSREDRLRYERYAESIPTVMVMLDADPPRKTSILQRGQYDQPGAQVSADVPQLFGELPAGAPRNRLGLAQWLTSSSQPLTSRVAVNRFWQMIFGTGLVKTAEDFGTQGEPPSHPELLDWLAVDFQRSNWDVKHLLRIIVTSATYRQSSSVSPLLHERDPENRLLARGPRQRLSAQVLRDQALAMSGMLVEEVGGPSVRPYQPAGLWKEIATDMDYVQSKGRDLYRRSVYTYWKRTVAPPNMIAFDAPTREACVVRKPSTNTPLQALALMNDTTFVECARLLATRALVADHQSDTARLNWMFRVVTSRHPTDHESAVLLQGLAAHRQEYSDHPEHAAVLLGTGDMPAEARIDPSKLAAFTVVANLLLNLDESITNQ